MTKVYCDICGRELIGGYARYKIKKRNHSWQESWWENLHVHYSCWANLCEVIKAMDGEQDACSN